MTYKILIVDDEPANLRMLERLFADQYEVITATSGLEALELLGAHDIALILCDQRMPGMTGIEFLKKAAVMRVHTVRIILTGYTDVDTLVEAVNSGVVYKYITKPWSNTDLNQNVLRAMEFYETIKRQNRLEEENQRMIQRGKATMRGFVNLALEMLDLKSPKISAHARRTAKYASAIGKSLNMNQKDLEQLFLAAILHEVAHVKMPAHLMSRMTTLRDGEMRLMQDYFRQGVKLLADVPALDEIAATISFQHDHFDGNGYSNRLSGEQIPLHARILAIIDAYDEMREPTGPLPGFTHEDAVLVLHAAAGRKYDPVLVSIFCSINFEDETPITVRAITEDCSNAHTTDPVFMPNAYEISDLFARSSKLGVDTL